MITTRGWEERRVKYLGRREVNNWEKCSCIIKGRGNKEGVQWTSRWLINVWHPEKYNHIRILYWTFYVTWPSRSLKQFSTHCKVGFFTLPLLYGFKVAKEKKLAFGDHDFFFKFWIVPFNLQCQLSGFQNIKQFIKDILPLFSTVGKPITPSRFILSSTKTRPFSLLLTNTPPIRNVVTHLLIMCIFS